MRRSGLRRGSRRPDGGLPPLRLLASRRGGWTGRGTFYSGPYGQDVLPSGNHRGRTNGRGHPPRGCPRPSMSCPLSESSITLVLSNLMGRQNVSARRPQNHERPAMVRRNTNAASRTPFKGAGVAATDHSKSSPLSSTGVGSQTQSSPSFTLITITDCSTNRL